jgi:glycosyltransferase involved in cell wall biosynthesis
VGGRARHPGSCGRFRRKLNVCFLLQHFGLSGGVGVVVEHAHRLGTEHGINVALVRTSGSEEAWPYDRLEGLELLDLDAARKRSFDVAVATWWETAYELFSLDAARYAYFVQSMEDRFYEPGAVHRLLAATTHNLPVSFITEARWISRLLRELHPESHVFVVRNGIPKEIFTPPEVLRISRTRPLRILIEGHPGVWFKGVDDALAAVALMREASQTTLVTPASWKLSDDSPVRVLGPITRSEMASLYGETDVVLKLSRVEGMFGPPLEGFHLGATCVVTPVTGHEEYVVHGWNGVVVDWDDIGGTARWLDLLARDRRLLHFLRLNALATARSWPSWHQSAQFMAAAIRRMSQLPPPPVAQSFVPLLEDLAGGAYEVHAKHLLLHRHLTHQNKVAAAAEEHVVRLEHDLELRTQQLEQRTRQLDDLHRTRAYRAAIAMRIAWKHPLLRFLSAPIRVVFRAARSVGRVASR